MSRMTTIETLEFIANLIPDIPGNKIRPEEWAKSKDRYQAMLGSAIIAARDSIQTEKMIEEAKRKIYFGR